VEKGEARKLHTRLVADQAKPVPLHVAASVVHQQLSGAARDWKGDAYRSVLDSTALALSHVSDVYYLDAQGKLRRIPDEELAVGMFEGGAQVFRTRSGRVYESLSMRRGDMSEAIAVLKNARGALHGAGEAKAGVRKNLG
jgi:hypothetical protein